MEPGMEIISSDGRRVGHVGSAQADDLGSARPEKTIPAGWIARIDREVILRKTLKEVMAGLGSTPTLSVAVTEYDMRRGWFSRSPPMRFPDVEK